MSDIQIFVKNLVDEEKSEKLFWAHEGEWVIW